METQLLLGPADGKPSYPIASILDQDQGSRFQSIGLLTEHSFQTPIHRVRAFVAKSKQDHTRLVQDSQSNDVSEVEVERQNNTGFCGSTLYDFVIPGTFETERADVCGIVAKGTEEIDGLRRDTGIRQKSHPSSTERMDLVLGKRRGVSKSLADIFFVEVG